MNELRDLEKRKMYQDALAKTEKCEYIRSGYAHNTYMVTPVVGCTMTPYEKALVADRGNVPFGYRQVGPYTVIHTD